MPRLTGIRCGGELNGHRRFRGEGKLFLNLRQVPVLRHAIRADAFIALNKQIIQISLAARAADTTHGIRDDAV